MRPLGIGLWLYTYRGVLPIPALAAVVVWARPSPAVFLAGLAVAAAGEAVRVAALRAIGPKSRVSGKVRTEELVTTGVYGCVRNPLYAANIVLGFGLAIASGLWPAIAAYPVVALAYYLPILLTEERALREKFGAAFQDYAAGVPRLLPRLSALRRPPSGPRHAWAELFAREANTIAALAWAAALLGRGFLGLSS